MFERFRRRRHEHEHNGDAHSGVATVEPRRAQAGEDADPDASPQRNRSERQPAAVATAAPVVTHEHVRTARLRQRAAFGGFHWGAAFFGLLVAIGLGALLIGIVAAAGAALGLTEIDQGEVRTSSDEIGIAGGALLVAVLMLAYFAGGYVAGRMSRFDGARQGAGVWVFALLLTGALAAAGAIAGSEYNVLERLDLPRIPVDEGTLTTAGAVALAAAAIGSLIAAIVGGMLGERYHRRVDAAALD